MRTFIGIQMRNIPLETRYVLSHNYYMCWSTLWTSYYLQAMLVIVFL